MENPIPKKYRGWLLVFGIVVSALALIYTPLSNALVIPDQWGPVVTAVVGAVTLITQSLSRANLSDDTKAPEVTQVTSDTFEPPAVLGEIAKVEGL